LTFGPLPSRRLGRSLGINHVLPKTCTYACVPCQLGRTTCLQANRQTFYALEAVVAAVVIWEKINQPREQFGNYLSAAPK
jgi:wyosine [tRNA(Phe)-imidazoG37] synthetase (radical SAM superfamily)